MPKEYVKKLTGKNPKDFEFAAAHIINNCDVNAFAELVQQGDFLFDFIKKNVEKRLSNVINPSNYRNLLSFLKIYSPDYEDLLVSSLVKFADEDLTDTMLELLENGSDEQRAYCAKYFSQINDTLAIDLLRKYSYSEFDALALNSAEALSAMKDEFSYNLATEKLKSEDEFAQLSAVRFLSAYKDPRAVDIIFEAIKKSSMPEHMASEVFYLKSVLSFLDSDFKYDAILALNHIVNGLGEIISPVQVLDFQFFEVFEKLIDLQKTEKSSQIAVVLLNAQRKFEQLTENNEYLFDESKAIKDEIYCIKDFLNSLPQAFWNIQEELVQEELVQESDFIFSALDLVQELDLSEALDKLKKLLTSSNQTIILRTVEVIKFLGKLDKADKTLILAKISDENIRLIIKSLFESD